LDAEAADAAAAWPPDGKDLPLEDSLVTLVGA